MGPLESAKQGQALGPDTYAELAVVLDGLLVVFLNIVREVVNWDIVVLNVFHDLMPSVSNKDVKPYMEYIPSS